MRVTTEVSSYVEGWMARGDALESLRKERCARLQLWARLVSDTLVRMGAIRVVLFGSAASGKVHPSSDLDIAVQGIAPERHVQAIIAAEDSVKENVRVDLILIEEANASLLKSIGRGTVLFES